MFALFRHQPTFRDETFQDFAAMLTEDRLNPTYRRELLLAELLDYSLESLKHLDDYLDGVYIDLPPDENFYRVVLRAGSYLGEVIRRHSSATEFHWAAYNDAAPFSRPLKTQGLHLGTAGVLWASREEVCLPLGKICQFIANGQDDSVHAFASALLNADLMQRMRAGPLGSQKA